MDDAGVLLERSHNCFETAPLQGEGPADPRIILHNIPQSFQDSREIAEYLYRKKPTDSTKNANEKAIDTGRSMMI
jgi:hypothetical protein